MKWIIASLCLAGPAFADVCPPAPDHAAAQTDLFDQLQALTTPVGARELSDQLWRLWTDAPDARAQELLDRGMQQRSGFDLLGARDSFDQLVEYCPDYAEGYNQRAFANFLDANYTGALVDLDVALSITPRHLGALTGKALTLMRLERNDEAQVILREALALNPWLSERALLTEPMEEEI